MWYNVFSGMHLRKIEERYDFFQLANVLTDKFIDKKTLLPIRSKRGFNKNKNTGPVLLVANAAHRHA